MARAQIEARHETPAVRGRAREPAVEPTGELQELADASDRVEALRRVQAMADDSAQGSAASTWQARADAVHRAAELGTRGCAAALPHLGPIQASFGHHDVSGVRAHLDASAREGARSMGAKAYAAGEHVAFESSPSLFMAAHEAAHVIQQRGGVQLFGGVGEAGDVHERHADEVARLVVRGESAEATLDRYADPARPRGRGPAVQPRVQFWGEPDHYAMGQLAGKKALAVLGPKTERAAADFALGEHEKDLGKGHMLSPDGAAVSVSESKAEDKLVLRDLSGKPMSYGAANRFAGDLAIAPLVSGKRAPSLMAWPAKLDSQGTDYGHISEWAEYTLMATNANHFFPLAGVEYRRQHAHAKQLMTMAVVMRAKARSSAEQSAATAMARQALMYEGFAGHFLADCFAAGHLTPHALGRIKLKGHSKAWAGALVNTWHDIFNALPQGMPTTLGRFHGDYSMDGHDLDYVSSVLSNSLLEIAMPWYAREAYDPELVLPRPDLAKIMEDPVAGALWAQMTRDYSGRMKALAKLRRRGAKTGLSKYAVYSMTTAEQVSSDEAIAPILEYVFGGGLEGPRAVESIGDIALTRGKVKQLVVGLYEMLGFLGGWQPSSGLSKDFEPTDASQLSYKFRPDLQSDNPLKHVTPATAPIVPLLDELEYWLKDWMHLGKALGSEELTLPKHISKVLAIKDKLEDARVEQEPETRREKKAIVRQNARLILKAAIEGFEGVEVSIPVDPPRYEQGPGSSAKRSEAISASYRRYLGEHGDPTAAAEAMRKDQEAGASVFPRSLGLDSGDAITATGAMLFALSRADKQVAAGPYRKLRKLLNALAADPWPRDKAHRATLYELCDEAADELNSALGDALPGVDAWLTHLREKLGAWKGKGRSSAETIRRDILFDLEQVLAMPVSELSSSTIVESTVGRVFDFSRTALFRTTGRQLGEFVADEAEVEVEDEVDDHGEDVEDEPESVDLSSTSLLGDSATKKKKKKKSWGLW